MKPPLRTKSVGTKVSEAEFAMLEERARASGLTLSEWVRDVVLAGPAEPGAELAGEVAEDDFRSSSRITTTEPLS